MRFDGELCVLAHTVALPRHVDGDDVEALGKGGQHMRKFMPGLAVAVQQDKGLAFACAHSMDRCGRMSTDDVFRCAHVLTWFFAAMWFTAISEKIIDAAMDAPAPGYIGPNTDADVLPAA